MDTAHERIGSEAVSAVVLILALPDGKETGDVGHLVEVDPEATHGVVHAGEDLHGDFAWIVSDELLVDFEDAFELAVESLTVYVGQVEIDHGLAVDAEAVFVNRFKDGAGGDVARDEIAVFGIPLFKEVPAVGVRDLIEGSLVAGFARDPD